MTVGTFCTPLLAYRGQLAFLNQAPWISLVFFLHDVLHFKVWTNLIRNVWEQQILPQSRGIKLNDNISFLPLQLND